MWYKYSDHRCLGKSYRIILEFSQKRHHNCSVCKRNDTPCRFSFLGYVNQLVSASAPSILISDDDRWFRQTLEEVFEPRGFRVLFAEDGAQAVEIVKKEEIHLAVVDMHMPRLTGVEVIREVRRFRVLLPCILVSGALDEEVRREAFAADAFEVLAKPVSLADITATVTSALEATYNWRSS